MILLVFWIGSILGVAGGVLGCKLYRPLPYFIFGLMIFSLFFSNLSINFFSAESYRGTTRGIEIHIADLLALILAFTIFMQTPRSKICWVPPMTYFFGLYILAAFLSWLFTDETLFNPLSRDSSVAYLKDIFLEPTFQTWQYPLFEITKLFRGYFIFWVTVNFIKDNKAIDSLTTTVLLMLFYAGLSSLVQRYVFGIHRVSALSDINIFNCFVGMLGAFIMPFAYYTVSVYKTVLYWAAVLAALVAIILTVSRSSLFGFLLAGLFITGASIIRFRSTKNLIAITLICLISFSLFFKAYETLYVRFIYNESTSSSLAGRVLYNDEAFLMGKEHMFGVGLNNFSAFSANEYAARVGTERGALAHNIWMLTFAEMGYPGLAAFVLLWLRYFMIYVQSYRMEMKRHDNLFFALLLGIFGAMMIMQIQNLFHFAFRQTSVFFLTNILMGLTVRIWLAQKEKTFKPGNIIKY